MKRETSERDTYSSPTNDRILIFFAINWVFSKFISEMKIKNILTIISESPSARGSPELADVELIPLVSESVGLELRV